MPPITLLNFSKLSTLLQDAREDKPETPFAPMAQKQSMQVNIWLSQK